MNHPNPYAHSGHSVERHYREMEIRTADPLKLVLILYKGALHHLQMARGCFESGDIGRRTLNLQKTIGMVSELQATLDFERGGEIARSLNSIYDYLLRRITEANLSRDVEIVDEVLRLLESLESAWTKIYDGTGKPGLESGRENRAAQSASARG